MVRRSTNQWCKTYEYDVFNLLFSLKTYVLRLFYYYMNLFYNLDRNCGESNEEKLIKYLHVTRCCKPSCLN